MKHLHGAWMKYIFTIIVNSPFFFQERKRPEVVTIRSLQVNVRERNHLRMMSIKMHCPISVLHFWNWRRNCLSMLDIRDICASPPCERKKEREDKESIQQKHRKDRTKVVQKLPKEGIDLSVRNENTWIVSFYLSVTIEGTRFYTNQLDICFTARMIDEEKAHGLV